MAYTLVLFSIFATIAVTVGVVGLVLKLGAAVMRAIFGAAPVPVRIESQVCAARGCGYDNRSGARYCAQCGRRLLTKVREQR